VSPTGFLISAAVIVTLYLIVHLLDFRVETTVLSGTAPSGADGLARGLIYIGLYFASVVVAPILVIAAAVLKALELVTARSR
jgi:hypothetical protein